MASPELEACAFCGQSDLPLQRPISLHFFSDLSAPWQPNLIDRQRPPSLTRLSSLSSPFSYRLSYPSTLPMDPPRLSRWVCCPRRRRPVASMASTTYNDLFRETPRRLNLTPPAPVWSLRRFLNCRTLLARIRSKVGWKNSRTSTPPNPSSFQLPPLTRSNSLHTLSPRLPMCPTCLATWQYIVSDFVQPPLPLTEPRPPRSPGPCVYDRILDMYYGQAVI